MKESIRTIIHNGKCVLLVNGRLTADLPPEAALQLAAALIQQARQIQNDQHNAASPIDQAILMRAGSKIGLTSNPKVIDEAYKEAQWNRDLRRYMPAAPSIQSREKFGIPLIRGGKQ